MVALPLGAAVISIFVPRLKGIIEDFRLPADSWTRFLFSLHQTLPVWSLQIPLAVFFLVVVAYLLRTGPTGFVWRTMVSLNWIPGFSRVQYSLRRAQFMELLALQTSVGIPLEQAFPQSAGVTEDPRLKQDAQQIAIALKAGRSLREAMAEAVAIPASWKWVFVTSHQGGLLSTAIRQLADTCRYRASRQAAWFNFAVPTAMALGCSVLIVTTYALVVLLPVVSLWKGLGQP
jgi:type II secretory pathway component PulF